MAKNGKFKAITAKSEEKIEYIDTKIEYIEYIDHSILSFLKSW